MKFPTKDTWTLTIHYYPELPAGSKPVPVEGFAERRPETYKPRSFTFANPPSRADFVSLINSLAWAQYLANELLPLLEGDRNQWPIIAHGFKAGSTSLRNGKDVLVGHVDISRSTVYDNVPYMTPSSVPAREIAQRFRGEKRQQVADFLLSHEHLLLERVLLQGTPMQSEATRLLKAGGLTR